MLYIAMSLSTEPEVRIKTASGEQPWRKAVHSQVLAHTISGVVILVRQVSEIYEDRLKESSPSWINVLEYVALLFAVEEYVSAL